MTRAEHMAWCKQRALDELEHSSGSHAVMSMISDLGKHPETANSVKVAAFLALTLRSEDPAEVKRYIEGFN